MKIAAIPPSSSLFSVDTAASTRGSIAPRRTGSAGGGRAAARRRGGGAPGGRGAAAAAIAASGRSTIAGRAPTAAATASTLERAPDGAVEPPAGRRGRRALRRERDAELGERDLGGDVRALTGQLVESPLHRWSRSSSRRRSGSVSRRLARASRSAGALDPQRVDPLREPVEVGLAILDRDLLARDRPEVGELRDGVLHAALRHAEDEVCAARSHRRSRRSTRRRTRRGRASRGSLRRSRRRARGCRARRARAGRPTPARVRALRRGPRERLGPPARRRGCPPARSRGR